jgi:hypothetical protein
MMVKPMRAALTAVLALLAARTAVQAMPSCSGEISAALLQPLPAPTVIALDLRDSTPVNVSLSNAFTNGMREAGAPVGTAPTVKLILTYQVLGQGGGSGGSGPGSNPGLADSSRTGWSSWAGNSQTWLQGGLSAALPDLPRYDMFSPQQAVQSALLVVRAEAHDARTNAIDWIGSVQCTMQSVDNQTLAYQLGYVIGGNMGKRVSRAPI